MVSWFSVPRNAQLARELAELGVRTDTDLPEPAAVDELPLAGATFVITGALAFGSRDEVKRALEERGATVSGSVSGRTSALVAGEGGGSKLDRARDRGVPVLGDDELARLLEGATLDDVLG